VLTQNNSHQLVGDEWVRFADMLAHREDDMVTVQKPRWGLVGWIDCGKDGMTEPRRNMVVVVHCKVLAYSSKVAYSQVVDDIHYKHREKLEAASL
jgi:hypothetical protein